MPSPLVRAARLSALATPLLWVMIAPSPAVAMTPEGWEVGDSTSTLTALLIFGGIPLALFLAIVALTVAPSIARGSSPSVDRWASPTWFNGPPGDRALSASAMGGADAKALTQSSTRALPSDGTGSGGMGSGGTGGSTAVGHTAGSSGLSASSSSAGRSTGRVSTAGSSTGGSSTGDGKGGSSAGGHTASEVAPGSPTAGGHTSRGLTGDSSTVRETATPSAGVPAEHDVLAAASSPGGGASARW